MNMSSYLTFLIFKIFRYLRKASLITQTFASISLLLLLTGCDSSFCINPVNPLSSDTAKTDIIPIAELRADAKYKNAQDVEQYGSWFDTNINLPANSSIYTEIYGTINICNNYYQYTISPRSTDDSFITIAAIPMSSNATPVTNSITVEKGDIITVEVDDIASNLISSDLKVSSPPTNLIYVAPSVNSSITLCSPWESVTGASGEQTCGMKAGGGLQIFIGDEMVYPSSNPFAPEGTPTGSDNPMPSANDAKIYREFPSLQYLGQQNRAPDNITGTPGGSQMVNLNMPADGTVGGKQYNINQKLIVFTASTSGVLGMRVPYYTSNPANLKGSYNVRVITPRSAKASDGTSYCMVEDSKPRNGDLGKVEYVVSPTYPTNNAESRILENFTTDEPGKLWLRVKDTDYTDNNLAYQLIFRVPKQTRPIASFLHNKVELPIRERVRDAAEIIYANFQSNVIFSKIVKTMLTLYVIIYAIYFMMGLVKVSQEDFVKRLCKLAVVIQLLQPSSWEFFNTYLFNIFTNGADALVQRAMGENYNPDIGIFGFIDDGLNVFLDPELWKFAAAWIPVGGVGLVFFIIFIYIFFAYIGIMMEAVIGYLLMILMIYLLITLAPIFITLILFERTRQLFDGWIKYFVSFTIQPVLVILSIIFLNSLIATLIWSAMARMCFSCAFPIFFNIGAFLFGIPIPIYLFCIPGFVIQDTIYDVFPKLIVVLLFVKTLKGMLSFIPQLSDALITMSFGSSPAMTGGGSMAQEIAHSLSEAVKTPFGLDQASVNQRNNAYRQDLLIKDRMDEFRGELKKNDTPKSSDANVGLKLPAPPPPSPPTFDDAKRELGEAKANLAKATAVSDAAKKTAPRLAKDREDLNKEKQDYQQARAAFDKNPPKDFTERAKKENELDMKSRELRDKEDRILTGEKRNQEAFKATAEAQARLIDAEANMKKAFNLAYPPSRQAPGEARSATAPTKPSKPRE